MIKIQSGFLQACQVKYLMHDLHLYFIAFYINFIYICCQKSHEERSGVCLEPVFRCYCQTSVLMCILKSAFLYASLLASFFIAVQILWVLASEKN